MIVKANMWIRSRYFCPICEIEFSRDGGWVANAQLDLFGRIIQPCAIHSANEIVKFMIEEESRHEIRFQEEEDRKHPIKIED